MPRGLRIIGYALIGLFSFILFLYLTFPFDVLKDRLLDSVEKGLKGGYEITVNSVSPRLIAGVTLKGVKIIERGEGESVPMWEADKIKLNVSLFSLMFGSTKIKFDVISGGGSVAGKLTLDKARVQVGVELDEFNLGTFVYLASKYGINLKSKIDGDADLNIDSSQVIRSSGTVNIQPNSIKFMASKFKAGAMGDIDLPEMVIGGGKSLISAEINKGAIKINSFKLEEGDLNIDLAGSVYLSSKASNYRLNLSGTFGFSEKVGQALPFLFIIEKQKNESGTFPLTIAGRLSKPQIKIGDFTVPL